MTATVRSRQSGLPDLSFMRILAAPRELVFAAWTDPKHLAEWWGPKGFTNPVCEVDVRPGGLLKIHMRAPDGTIYPGSGVFREVVAPERLVFTSTFDDDKGNHLIEALNTVTFTELGSKTKLTLRATVLNATDEVAENLAGMEEGWTQSLERLAGLIQRLR